MDAFTLVIIYALSHHNPPPLVYEFNDQNSKNPAKECKIALESTVKYIVDSPEARAVYVADCIKGRPSEVLISLKKGKE